MRCDILREVGGSSSAIQLPSSSPLMRKIGNQLFTSTHPSRGATNIHKFIPFICTIYIHTPLTRCDSGKYVNVRIVISRGATSAINSSFEYVSIYIHAPFTRCDFIIRRWILFLSAFTSTHLSQGATSGQYNIRPTFTSAHPLQGATARYSILHYLFAISSINISTQIE